MSGLVRSEVFEPVFPAVTLCSGVLQKEEVRSLVKEKRIRSKDGIFDLSVDLNHEDFYFPSVELLTAQVRPQKSTKAGICSAKKGILSAPHLGSSLI